MPPEIICLVYLIFLNIQNAHYWSGELHAQSPLKKKEGKKERKTCERLKLRFHICQTPTEELKFFVLLVLQTADIKEGRVRGRSAGGIH